MTSHSKEIDVDIIDALISYTEQVKVINDKIDDIKDLLRKDIQTSIGTGKIVYNGKLEVSLGEDTSSTTIDVRSIELYEPELYKDLLEKYGKPSIRKGALRIKNIE